MSARSRRTVRHLRGSPRAIGVPTSQHPGRVVDERRRGFRHAVPVKTGRKHLGLPIIEKHLIHSLLALHSPVQQDRSHWPAHASDAPPVVALHCPVEPTQDRQTGNDVVVDFFRVRLSLVSVD